jgi:hypothetical protein
MELINATRMTAGYNMGLEPSGRESLVVVIKGTFRFPQGSEPATHVQPAESQQPRAPHRAPVSKPSPQNKGPVAPPHVTKPGAPAPSITNPAVTNPPVPPATNDPKPGNFGAGIL